MSSKMQDSSPTVLLNHANLTGSAGFAGIRMSRDRREAWAGRLFGAA